MSLVSGSHPTFCSTLSYCSLLLPLTWLELWLCCTLENCNIQYLQSPFMSADKIDNQVTHSTGTLLIEWATLLSTHLFRAWSWGNSNPQSMQISWNKGSPVRIIPVMGKYSQKSLTQSTLYENYYTLAVYLWAFRQIHKQKGSLWKENTTKTKITLMSCF